MQLLFSRVALRAAVAGVVMAPFALPAPALAAPPSSDYRLVWGDEFNGTLLDTSKWNYNYPWGPTHNHDAYMDPGNVVLGDGTLTLVAERRAQGGKAFTSGAINTGYTKKTFNGGYLEASILLPSTPGSWPAFWGLYDGWPPEADIMEFPLGAYDASDYHTAFHYRNNSGGNSAGAGKINDPLGGAPLNTDYHTFGMEWIEDDWVGFYLDGRLVSQFGEDAAIAQMQRMYLILNYAVGGWAGTPSLEQWAPGHTDEMKIDWVRVWDTTAWADGISNWVAGSGSWDTAGHWDNGVPGQTNQIARFDADDGNARSISWTNARIVGGVVFDGNSSFTLGNSNSGLTITHSSGTATVSVAASNTAAHEIRSRLELVSNVAFNNDSATPLTVSGEISGDASVIVNGPGPVVLTRVNRYTGDTLIDGGSQGPAMLRVTASDALGTGDILFNPQGNDTSGQLQLAGNATLGNAVILSGRHGSTPAIVNRSGNSRLAGTISAVVGGGRYAIQSDAGLLTLSGTATGASGVALRAHASGTRTFTLAGAANGIISGQIVNGTGIVALRKDGPGTWTIGGGAANTHTGLTEVVGGRLVLAKQDLSSVGNHGSALQGNLAVRAGASVEYRNANQIGDDDAVVIEGELDVGQHTDAVASLLFADSGAYRVEVDDLASDAGTGRLHAFGTAGADGDLILTSTAPGSSLLYAPTPILSAGSGVSGHFDRVLGLELSAPTHDVRLAVTYEPQAVLVQAAFGGDANLDGKVSLADFLILRSAFGQADATWSVADFTGDGTVSLADFLVLRSNFGAGNAATAPGDYATMDGWVSSVPEPAAALGLASVAGLLLVCRRPPSRM